MSGDALASAAAVDRSAVDSASAMTDQQRQLERHLHDHWGEICGDELFKKAKVVANCPPPLTPQAVFSAVLTDDYKRVLFGLRPCFPGHDSEHLDRSSKAFKALELIAQVAAESFVQDERRKLDQVCSAQHDTLPTGDRVLAAVIAAAIFRFGLRFKDTEFEPDNVFYVEPPGPEFGYEEGRKLVRMEMISLINQRDLRTRGDLKAMKDVTPAAFGALIDVLAESLDCPVVTAVRARKAFSIASARERLVADMKSSNLTAIFIPDESTELPDDVKGLLADLSLYLTPFFASGAAAEPKEQETMQTDVQKDVPPTVVNMTFNGPVENVNQANAPGAQAAGHDINNGLQASDLVQLLASLRQAVESHPALGGTEKGRDLLADIEEIGELAAKPPAERSASDAKLLKRCVDGLEQGAKAVDNGSKIVEKLAPVVGALKAAWPTVAALFI